MTDPTQASAARLTAIVERWKGVSAATYGTLRDKAFDQALSDIQFLLGQVDTLRQEQARLEADRNEWQRRAVVLEDGLSISAEKCKQAREALKEYGRHTEGWTGCAITRWNGTPDGEKPACTCGLDAALKAVR